MDRIEKLLRPILGYIELGMTDDAHKELEALPEELKTHPSFLEARLRLYMELQKWEAGAALGKSLCCLWPDNLQLHFKTAYCFRQCGQTQKAKEILLAAPQEIRETAIYYLSMAQYETILSNHDQAQDLLRRCYEINPKFRFLALEEMDFRPLWMCIFSS